MSDIDEQRELNKKELENEIKFQKELEKEIDNKKKEAKK